VGQSGSGGTDSGGAAGGGGSGGSGGGIAHTGVWRIMALGDSITQSTCYPQLLSKKLEDAGHTNFELIGSSTNNQSCSGAPNVQTEGHGGYILTCLTGDAGSTNCNGKGMPSELTTWLAARPAPDVALILFGTNDVWNNIPVSSILAGYTDLVTGLRDANPNVVIFLGRILPMFPDSSCCNDRVIELNASLVGWATLGTEASPIYIVPIYESVGDPNGFKAKTNNMDGVHPNEMAAGQMADAWMAALVPHGIGD